MRAAFLCLAALAQLALSATAEPVKIPLFRRDVGYIKAGGKQLTTGVLAGQVQIGNPPQNFTMAFDTATGYSWVRGSKCKTENCRGRCSYYSTRSSTAVSTGKKFSVEYGDSCIDTHVYLDTFRFSGVTVHDMPFGGAYRMNGFADGFDGYLGLGRSVNWNISKIRSSASAGLSKRDALPNSAFVPNAYQQGAGVGSAQFGLYVTSGDGGFDQSGSVNANSTQLPAPSNTTQPTVGSAPLPPSVPLSPPTTPPSSGGSGVTKRDSGIDKPAGYLILGGVDNEAINGNITYLKLSNDEKDGVKSWDVNIRSASFGSKLVLKQASDAIAAFSTSYQYISMPAQQADEFHKTFGGTHYVSTKTYSIKCSMIKHLPNLKLQLDDYIIEIPPVYWTREIDNGRDCCATRISRGGSDKDWVLGSSFTNLFYTAYNPDDDLIGLGLLKDTNTAGIQIYKA
ncbi:aspartic peptidase domain-containing protein [Spinellus fusiger]|nr:aspartic peptidase domain-containing protein [Spinellus fusiger]